MENDRYLVTGPADPDWTFILAHGAGVGMDHPGMELVADGLVSVGFRVVRFEFPYMNARRLTGRGGRPDPPPVLMESWRETIADTGPADRLIIGGKSMGGRIASMIADEVGVAGLVCLGYPFHPAGKPDRLRTQHLYDLGTPTLIIQGSRDQLGLPEEIESYGLPERIGVLFLEDGDHSFRPRKSSGRTLEQNIGQAVREIARFSETLG